MTDGALTLWSMPSSGNSYKVRLLLAHLGRPYRHVGLEYGMTELDAARREGRLPLGKLPCLELADGRVLAESNAILWYLGEGTEWVPMDPLRRAEMLAWMFFEQNRHEPVIAVRAALLTYPQRAHLATPERLAALYEAGQEVLATMDAALRRRDWLVEGEAPTLADISLYGYTHSAEVAGGYDFGPFGALRDWLARVAALPGHVALHETPPNANPT